MTATDGSNNVVDMTQVERVTVRLDSLMSDEQLLVAGGYSDVWSDILTSGDYNLGEPFTGEQEMIIVRADRFPKHGNIYAREGVEIMKSYGFRPPTLRELLTFGCQNLPDKWLSKKDEIHDSWEGSTSKWYYVIGANLHYRVPNEPWYDSAPAIWSHSGRRGLTVAGMYNAMINAWPRNPHYLWVPCK